MPTAGTSNGGQQHYEQGVVIQAAGGVHQQAMFAAMDTCGGQQSSVSGDDVINRRKVQKVQR